MLRVILPASLSVPASEQSSTWFHPCVHVIAQAEEWTGLGCDWALAFMWYRLYKACNNAEDKDMVRWGLLGAWFHMLEILPLLALLLGVFPVPSIPGATETNHPLGAHARVHSRRIPSQNVCSSPCHCRFVDT